MAPGLYRGTHALLDNRRADLCHHGGARRAPPHATVARDGIAGSSVGTTALRLGRRMQEIRTRQVAMGVIASMDDGLRRRLELMVR